MTPADILDLRAVQLDPTSHSSDARQDIITGLSQPVGKRSLPTTLLYDEHGLRLYDDITTKAPEYYLFSAEENILKTHASDIVRVMCGPKAQIIPGQVVLELGAGALRKTSLILDALADLVSPPTSAPGVEPVTYYALDLERRELDRTLSQLAASSVGPRLAGRVALRGMHGTYDDGVRFVSTGGLATASPLLSPSSGSWPPPRARDASPTTGSTDGRSERSSISRDASYSRSSPPSTPDPDVQAPPMHLLFLGSSLGNFERGADADFLRSLPLRSGDTLLLGLDGDNDARTVEIAYNDPGGHTRAFIMNGLRTAGLALGDEAAFHPDQWEYSNRYDVDERRHEAYFRSKCAQVVVDPMTKQEFVFEQDELLRIEVSQKYSDTDAYTLFANSDLRPIQRWMDPTGQYSLWLLERPAFVFAANATYAAPSVSDWRTIWSLWDTVTREMIPECMLFQKPIDLRHICLFYLGHIPTFLDIHLSRLLGEPHTEPEHFKDIFERGIDPIVDDPTQCHSHSEVPQRDDEWPSVDTILDFQSRVRERLLRVYEDAPRPIPRKTARVLFMTYEHEAFHAETLLYMLIQRAGEVGGTLPPQGFAAPHWDTLARQWRDARKPSTPAVTLGPARVSLGHNDLEIDDVSTVDSVTADNHEFGWDNENPKREVEVAQFSIEWRPVTNSDYWKFWKTHGKTRLGGQMPASWLMEDGADKPLIRTLYGPVSLDIASDWPLLASYDELSAYAVVQGGRLPTEAELRLFLDKFASPYEAGANAGFHHWHPTPATTGGGRDGGRGDNGGVWEWTSTLFEAHDGFVPSELYPGYSVDFFDGRHQVVLGGSYASIPRLANRRSLRNYYQRNYPYAWCGARVAYDIASTEAV